MTSSQEEDREVKRERIVTAEVRLDPREDDFVWAIGCGYAPTAAAEMAGYSKGTARALLDSRKKPHVVQAIRDLAANAVWAVREIERREGLRGGKR